MRLSATFFLSSVLLWLSTSVHGNEKVSISAFDLTSVDGNSLSVSVENDQSDFTVVCFLGIECPLAKLYGPRLSKMASEFESSGVRFIGIDSNRQDSIEELKQYIAKHEIGFPIAKDFGNVIADTFGAKRTPEVFVLDQHLNVRYRGIVDDQYEPGISKAKAGTPYLRQALRELVSGRGSQYALCRTDWLSDWPC